MSKKHAHIAGKTLMIQKSNNIEKKGLMLFVSLGLFISIMSGILLSVLAITKFENYFHPYLFASAFSIVGVIIGYIISSSIKSFVLTSNKNITDYTLARMYIITGFIGFSLFFGVKTNSALSTLDYKDAPRILNKTQKESRYKSPGYHKLHFEIQGDLIDVRCSKDYWDYISMGQRINIEVYKSKIEFDYINLPDE